MLGAGQAEHNNRYYSNLRNLVSPNSVCLMRGLSNLLRYTDSVSVWQSVLHSAKPKVRSVRYRLALASALISVGFYEFFCKKPQKAHVDRSRSGKHMLRNGVCPIPQRWRWLWAVGRKWTFIISKADITNLSEDILKLGKFPSNLSSASIILFRYLNWV